MLAVDEETDGGILHNARFVKEKHQVAPLSLLCQFGTPEANVGVV